MAQGRLLLQDTFLVSDPEDGPLGRMKERRVFLFEQLVIFSEPLDKKKGFSLPGFLYKNSIKVIKLPAIVQYIYLEVLARATDKRVPLKLSLFSCRLLALSLQVSCLGLEESVEGDPCKFILTSRSPSGAVESFVLHSSHPGVCDVWTLQISQMIESQRNFLNGWLAHTHRPCLVKNTLLPGSNSRFLS